MSIVYRKTTKGQTEIETRAHRLPPRLRAALIVVDGKRSADELVKLIPTGAAEALAQLDAEGFIKEKAAPGFNAATAPAPLGSEVPVTAPAPLSFEQLRREAVRKLTELVGPMGEALAMKMERARSDAELQPLIDTARQVIANTRGNQAAADYGARFGV